MSEPSARTDGAAEPVGSAPVFEKIDTFKSWEEDYYHPLAERYYDRAIPDMLRWMGTQPGDLVLDAGCGPGVHSIRAAKFGCRVHAIDISQTVLAEAERRAAQAGVSEQILFQQADLTKLPFEDATFERVFSWGVIIHVPAIEAALRELARIVKPGGHLALFVTNSQALDYRMLGLGRALLRKPRLPLERRPMGWGCEFTYHGEALWVWRVDVAAVSRLLGELGLRRERRIAGQFSELQRRMRGLPRRAVLHWNNLWYNLGLPAWPSVANLLIYRKDA